MMGCAGGREGGGGGGGGRGEGGGGGYMFVCWFGCSAVSPTAVSLLVSINLT